jgi:nicotinate-nucleotide adenylyltransferase
MRKIVLFGGSFNPPHWGHIFSVCKVAQLGEFDQIFVVPVYEHAYGKELVNFDNRLHMCQLAFGWIPGVEVSDIEERLRETVEQVYTWHVVQELHHRLEEFAKVELYLLGGRETEADMENWYNAKQLIPLVKVLVIDRRDGVMPSISSTDVREVIGGVDCHPGPHLQHMVPGNIRKYIAENNLYVPKERIPRYQAREL